MAASGRSMGPTAYGFIPGLKEFNRLVCWIEGSCHDSFRHKADPAWGSFSQVADTLPATAVSHLCFLARKKDYRLSVVLVKRPKTTAVYLAKVRAQAYRSGHATDRRSKLVKVLNLEFREIIRASLQELSPMLGV